MIMFIFSEGTCSSCCKFTQQRNNAFPAPATPENKARVAGWKKGGDAGLTIHEVREKFTAFSVLKLREETELSTSRVLKNWCIKLLFQEQRF